MGLLNWLRSLIAPRRVVRDVSQMTSQSVGGDAATREEVVDTTGQPLKPGAIAPGHPGSAIAAETKPRPTTHMAWPRKKVKVMARAEADRLFSETMRTRDRNVRDLATDVEQLQRLGLPVWGDEGELAAALGLTIPALRHYSIHRQRETTPHYVVFAIPKRSGGHRLIHAPKRRLKAIQRALHEQLVSKLPVSPYAHGFREGRSVATNAAHSRGQAGRHQARHRRLLPHDPRGPRPWASDRLRLQLSGGPDARGADDRTAAPARGSWMERSITFRSAPASACRGPRPAPVSATPSCGVWITAWPGWRENTVTSSPGTPTT